ncbi:MAG: PAS domain S-box protein [Methylococcales bacterium]|nr:PAS domain S-box protein [Methylococcaceae bacterium]
MKLLLIDDNDEERAITSATLRSKFRQIKIVEISSREDCDATIAQGSFDLVILEFKLGWTDGLTLFNTIHKRFSCIPVILLTDSGNEQIAVTAIKLGFADHITKSHRQDLTTSVEQSLLDATNNNRCPSTEQNQLLCEKWDLAISRLTSDFAYSMRVTIDGEPFFEWITSQLKALNTTPLRPITEFKLPTHPDDIGIVKQRFANLLAGNEDTSEYRIISEHEGIRWFKDHALPIRDWSTGKVIRIYGAIQDITLQRQTEDRLRLMQRAIDCSNNGIVITGLAEADYGIVYANNAFLKLTGYTLNELLGQNCRILQQREPNQSALETIRSALNQDTDGYAILRNYRKDGSLFWNEVYISPIRDSQDRVTHYLGVQNDVTQRYEMKMLLSKNEAKMRAIFESVSDAVIIFDELGGIQSLNLAAEKLFGYSSNSRIKEHIDTLIPDWKLSDKSTNLSGFLNHFCNDQIPFFKREINACKKDGTLFPVAFGVHEIHLDQQRLFVGTLHDLTESKRAEVILRTSEERYRALFENTADAIFVNRGGNKIEQVNNACLHLWGASRPDELINKCPIDLFHPDYHAVIKERIQAMLSGKKGMPFIEEKIIRLDGSIADVLVSGIPFEDEQGPLIFVILLDITERKQAEVALLESKNQYQKLSNHLELVREEERTRIAREIHDELGSFLTAFKIDLSWLNKKLPDDLTDCHQKILLMTEQTHQVIQTVKRIITDLRPSLLDQLGLMHAIDWLVENFRQRTRIVCVLSLPKNEVLLDPNRSTAVFRIAQESLTNIVTHANASHVKVKIKIIKNALRMTIYDNGCGIVAANNGKSIGYGIPGMKERARHFGGELILSSKPGMGTTITLTLPLHSKAQE